VPATGRDRLPVRAIVDGSSFYEVTFLAKVGSGRWQDIGTDDNAPYRVFHDVADVRPGTQVSYRAIVLDNARHTRSSSVRSSTVSPPAITLEAPNEGQRVRGEVEVRAITTPEHAHHVVRFQRSVNGAAFTDIGTDDSSPVYTAFDNTAGLPDGAMVTYRAILTDRYGSQVTSDTRSVKIVQARVTEAVIHYNRPDANYAAWGLHLFGPGLGEPEPAWGDARPFDQSDAFGALRRIPVGNDEQRIGFIVHQRPPGNPDVKDTDNDRYFSPLSTPEIWIRQGDARIFSCAAANDSCVVPSVS
jgi:alpha-amylase